MKILLSRFIVISLFMLPVSLWASVTTITLQSDPGDFIGAGKRYIYTNADSIITPTNTGNYLSIKVDGDETWYGDFELPDGFTELMPGSYTNLTRWPFHDSTVGGLDWSGEGRGCNTLTGWIIIDKVTYVSGVLTELEMQFEQHCEGGAAALHGDIKWYADDTTMPPGPVTPIPGNIWNPDPAILPQSGNFVYLESQNGDWVGQGSTYKYNEPNNAISVTADNNLISVNVDGWWGRFKGMNFLNSLEAGFYGGLQRYPFHNPVKGGLSWSGQGRGCNKLTGWFAVDKVTYIDSLLAEIQIRFEQHCEGGDPALNGVINWVNPDLPPAPPVLTASSRQKGAWITTTLNWSTEATGVDIYYNGQLVDFFDQQTSSASYSNRKQFDQVYSVCNTGTQDCSEYVANVVR